jgi:hypothetical protein
MDGKQRILLQERNGVRFTVQDIDALGMHLGYSKTKVLTPFAEERLRSGYVPQKNIRILCEIDDVRDGVKVVLCFPTGYPTSGRIRFELSGFGEKDSSLYADVSQRLEHFIDDTLLEMNASDSPGASGYAIKLVNHLISVARTIPGSSGEHIFNLETFDIEEDEEEEGDEGGGQDGDEDDGEGEGEAEGGENEDDELERDQMAYVYSCRKCSTVLFTSAHIDPHTRADGSICECDDVIQLLAPPLGPDWLNGKAISMADAQGRLNCPAGAAGGGGCGNKIGMMSWAGAKCNSCFEWVCPSFQVSSSKVDCRTILLSDVVAIEDP